jgi:hypothetical protein
MTSPECIESFGDHIEQERVKKQQRLQPEVQPREVEEEEAEVSVMDFLGDSDSEYSAIKDSL